MDGSWGPAQDISLPNMPYPQRTAGFVTAFINSQRPPPGSHLSAFLHGESTMGGSRKDRPSNAHNVTTRRATAPDLVAPMDEFGAPHNPDLRPRASTMSIIDPMHSPVLGIRRHGQSTTMFDDVSRDPEHGARGVFHPDAQLDWREEAVFKNPDRKQKPRKSATEVWEPSAPKPMLFPKVKDRRVRQKSIGTLISGTLLTLVLTTCKYDHSMAVQILMCCRPRSGDFQRGPDGHVSRGLYFLHPHIDNNFRALSRPALHAGVSLSTTSSGQSHSSQTRCTGQNCALDWTRRAVSVAAVETADPPFTPLHIPFLTNLTKAAQT